MVSKTYNLRKKNNKKCREKQKKELKKKLRLDETLKS